MQVVRNALAPRTRTNPGRLHKCAGAVARARHKVLDLRWPSMWREGWGSPWPAHVIDRWWEMAAGGLYVAHLRRHHDPTTTFCRVCLARTGAVHLDTYEHLFYGCPEHAALWAWANACLRRARLDTWSVAAFMLYGSQVLGCAITDREHVGRLPSKGFGTGGLIRAHAGVGGGGVPL